MALALVVVDVVGGDVAQAVAARQLDEATVAIGVAVDEVLLKLDVDVVATEPLDVAKKRCFRAGEVFRGDERRHFAALAAGEGDQAARVAGEDIERKNRLFALACEVGGGEQAAEVAVALGRLREQREVVAVGERQLGACDGADAKGFRGLGELHRSVEAVVIGEGEGLVAQFPGAQHQVVGAGGAVEQRPAGVEVELGAVAGR